MKIKLLLEIYLFSENRCHHRFLLCVCRAWKASKWNRNSSQATRSQQPPFLCRMICLQNCMEVKVRPPNEGEPWVCVPEQKQSPGKAIHLSVGGWLTDHSESMGLRRPLCCPGWGPWNHSSQTGCSPHPSAFLSLLRTTKSFYLCGVLYLLIFTISEIKIKKFEYIDLF